MSANSTKATQPSVSNASRTRRGFEATADLLAVSFNEGVVSARLFDTIEVFPNTNESVGLFLGI